MELRSTIIRLAHAKPELRGVLLPLLTKEAADPKYQDYVDKKRREGEKPLSQEQWEVKVLGKKPEAGGGKAPEGEGGEKGEKGEGKGSKKKDIHTSPEREKAIVSAINGALEEQGFLKGEDWPKLYGKLFRDPESVDGVVKTLADATKGQFKKLFEENDLTTQDEYDEGWRKESYGIRRYLMSLFELVPTKGSKLEQRYDDMMYDKGEYVPPELSYSGSEQEKQEHAKKFEAYEAQKKVKLKALEKAAMEALRNQWDKAAPKAEKAEAPKAEKAEGKKPAKTFKKNYRPKMEGVMTKHGLTDDDADQVIKFSLDRPKKGKPQSPEELKRRFMEKAKPETKERMKNMTAAEFMVMLRAILDQEEGEMGKMASRILKQASGDAALLALLKVACGYMADDDGEGKEGCGYTADDKEAKQMHNVKPEKGKGTSITTKADPQRDPYARSLAQGQFKPKTIGDKRQKLRDKFKD